jgi:hypothetical protein
MRPLWLVSIRVPKQGGVEKCDRPWTQTQKIMTTQTIRISRVDHLRSCAVVHVVDKDGKGNEMCFHSDNNGRSWVYEGQRSLGGNTLDRWFLVHLGYDQKAAISLLTAATTKLTTHTACKNGCETLGTLEGNTLSYEAKYGIEEVQL